MPRDYGPDENATTLGTKRRRWLLGLGVVRLNVGTPEHLSRAPRCVREEIAARLYAEHGSSSSIRSLSYPASDTSGRTARPWPETGSEDLIGLDSFFQAVMSKVRL